MSTMPVYSTLEGNLMQITVNGEPAQIQQSPFPVEAALRHFKVEQPDMVSVQVNGSFIERPAFSTTLLSEGDELDFLYFMGGGSR